MKALIPLFILLGSLSSLAQTLRSDSISLIFRQSKAKIETGIDSNRERLDSMASELTENAARISSLSITGAASPEGSASFNETLSERRAAALFDYLSDRNLIPDSTSYGFIGRNWKGLLADVEADKNVPFREETLNMLRAIVKSIDDGNPDSNINLDRIKEIGNGATYRYLFDKFFSSLRTSTLAIRYLPYDMTIPSGFEPALPIDAVVPPLSLIPLPENTMSICRPFYMDIKTNLLYDALALPNIGVDFYVGKNFSVGANWIYGWWDKDSTHRYWRAYGGDLNFRWWFGSKAHEKPLSGHHIGVFAGVITYDFEFGGKGYMGGLPGENLWHRCNFISGVEYGYSLPVSRRLNIDFSLALGYVGGRMIKYIPEGNSYYWQSTSKVRYFGPTKLEISLVWLLGCDNYNRKKGGVL
ncbi:MAG: DUF3575 domain-containing protein [Muribaculaceae bacterium]|nr:DUF3575 domain-containing protein [Muribaculaceae bacterium]